jgi:hypothetical protein
VQSQGANWCNTFYNYGFRKLTPFVLNVVECCINTFVCKSLSIICTIQQETDTIKYILCVDDENMHAKTVAFITFLRLFSLTVILAAA